MPPTPSAGGSGRGRGGGGGGRGSRGGARSGSSARATAAAAATGGGGGATGRRVNVGIGQGRRGPFVYRGEFKRDVQGLMYAFGDVRTPDPASVAVLEDMAVSFLVDLVRRARPTPAQVNIPTNNAHINAIAQAHANQQTFDRQQARMDEAVNRAAAAATSGASASTQAQAGRRAADALQAADEQRKLSEMPVRPSTHPHLARTRLTVEDVKFACRKDAKMTSRIEELIYLDKEITSARRAFDVPADEAIQDNTVGAGNVAAPPTS